MTPSIELLSCPFCDCAVNLSTDPKAVYHPNNNCILSCASFDIQRWNTRASSWRPIHDAPKDGTWILAYRPKADGGRHQRLVVARWDEADELFIWPFYSGNSEIYMPSEIFDIYEQDLSERDDDGEFVNDTYGSDDFTHFMPLPPPPKEGE